jgi:hypothetical protein
MRIQWAMRYCWQRRWRLMSPRRDCARLSSHCSAAGLLTSRSRLEGLMKYRSLGGTGIKVSPYALGAQKIELRRRPLDERSAA